GGWAGGGGGAGGGERGRGRKGGGGGGGPRGGAGSPPPPATRGRHNRCRTGPASTRLTRYFTRPSTPFVSRDSTITAARRQSSKRSDQAGQDIAIGLGHEPHGRTPAGLGRSRADVLSSRPRLEGGRGLRSGRGPGVNGRPVVRAEQQRDMPGTQRLCRAGYLGQRGAVHILGQ